MVGLGNIKLRERRSVTSYDTPSSGENLSRLWITNNEGGCEWTKANSIPVNRLQVHNFRNGQVNLVQSKPKFLGFVDERHASMHCLHAQHLIVALLIIEH